MADTILGKMFVHFAKKTAFTAALATDEAKLTNSIVFIQDSQEIWTHGQYYAIPETYKDKITTLETAVAALQEVTSFNAISDGTTTATATKGSRTITFNQGTNTNASVKVSGNGVTIDVPVKTGTAEGSINFKGGDVVIGGWSAYKTATNTAIQSAQNAATEAGASALQALETANAKVASVTSTGAIKTDNTTATTPTLSLSLDNSGNVQFVETTTGLKATVEIPEDHILGIADGDDLLRLDANKKLNSGFTARYNAETKAIQFFGVNNKQSPFEEIDCTNFIKDGMIDNVKLDESDNLVITFNTDAGKDPISIPLKKFIDAYDGANLMLKSLPAIEEYSAPKNGESVDTAIAKLAKGIENASESGVMALGGKTGFIGLANVGTSSLDFHDVSFQWENELTSKPTLKARVPGIGTAAQHSEEDFVASVKGAANGYVKVDATTGGTLGTDVTLTPTLTMQEVAKASTTAKGLAEASDVKAYIDNLFAWEEH